MVLIVKKGICVMFINARNTYSNVNIENHLEVTVYNIQYTFFKLFNFPDEKW